MPSTLPPLTQLDTKTFLLTVSVKGDLLLECQESVLKWIRKNTHMNYVVIEHGSAGKRHLHAVLVFKESRLGKKLHENLWDRHVKPFHPDSIGKYAVKVQVCPGNDWYNTYLKKESDVEVLSANYNPDEAETYFPTEATQAVLMEPRVIKGVACPRLETDVKAWADSDFSNTPQGAHEFIQYRMFVLKDMMPSQDNKKLVEKSRIYWRYRNGITALSERQLWLHKQEEEGPSFDVPGSIRDSSRGAVPRI